MLGLTVFLTILSLIGLMFSKTRPLAVLFLLILATVYPLKTLLLILVTLGIKVHYG
jgi:hypothetical protein